MMQRAATKFEVRFPWDGVGKPEEIAAPALFLCTEHAAHHREIFNVNGGAVLCG